MPDSELIACVLGVQAGFVTPTQVMSAASAGLIDRDGPNLLARLEQTGALTPARRALLDAMVAEALAAAAGDPNQALDRMGGAAAIQRTFGETGPLPQAAVQALADSERLVPTERPGQYTRLGELGRGGQSVVSRVRDEFIGREVALKELLRAEPSGTDSASAARGRFLREARLTGQLDHRGIAAVHELARRADGTLFCVQKLIRGETLKAKLAHCETLEQRLALLPQLIDACQTVAYAHSRGVIHRDLKPSNIMVGAFGETVIVDWGLGKKKGEADPLDLETPTPSDPALTAAGAALGTPAYMSPEQARGAAAEVDERSDVFGLGVILYELLTARIPFEGATPEQTLEKVVQGRFPPVRQVCPGAPPELAAVADRALSALPANRYAGAEPLAQELLAYRAGRRVAAYEYRSWDLIKKFIARNRAFSAVSMAALVVLIGSSVAISIQLHLAHLSLARSFLERARAAEQSSDWARAAGYYAASRIQSDSREGRWGYARAHGRMPRQIFSRHEERGSFADVGFLPDGRALVVATEPPWVIGRDADSGKELWRYQHSEPLLRHRVVFGGQVRLSSSTAVRYLDGATGDLLAAIPVEGPKPCGSSPMPARAYLGVADDGAPYLAGVDASGQRHVLMTDLGGRIWSTLCEVSADGERLGIQGRDGVVHLWDLEHLEEVASRPAPDAAALHHTAYGLAVVRAHSIQVFGGPQGDFVVSLPGRRGSGQFVSIADAVSPDGQKMVVARAESNQADVVDLSARRVVSSLSFAPGKPGFALSPGGDRLLVTSTDETTLTAWDIRPPPTTPPAIAGEHRMDFSLSEDGRRILVLLAGAKYRAAVYDQAGTEIRTVDINASRSSNATLSGDGRRMATSGADGISVIDVDTGAVVAHLDCQDCLRLSLSRDGRRLATNSGGEVVSWDVDRGFPLWRERDRAGDEAEPLGVSGDGRTILWGHDGTLYLRRDGTGDQELRLGEKLKDADFSQDGTRVAVVTHDSIGVWETSGLRPVFRVPNPSWVPQEIHWSHDGSALLNMRDALGTLLIDSSTGQPFANIELTRPAAFGTNEIVSPGLDYRLSVGDGSWEIAPLPGPDGAPPERGLTQLHEEAGLVMHGVELDSAQADSFP